MHVGRASTPGMRGVLDRALEPRRRLFRAALAAAAWLLAIAPTALGLEQCTFAKVFHAPCPGCGLTRAVHLLLAGHWRESIAMHPLAVPLLVAGSAFALSTVWTTYLFGAPLVHKSRFGRAAIAALALTYAAMLALWGLRWLGWFGGPVPVS